MDKSEVIRLVDICNSLMRNGSDIEDVLAFLKKETKAKISSIMVVSKLLDVSMSEAKLLVHQSKAWQDEKSRDEKLHEEIFSEPGSSQEESDK
jgi:ribosomal protein L7/L12